MGRPVHSDWWLRYWMWDRLDVMDGDDIVCYGEHPAAAIVVLTERGLMTTPLLHLLRWACRLHRASQAESDTLESRLQSVPLFTDALAAYAFDDGQYYVLDAECVAHLPDVHPNDVCPVSSPR